MIKIEFTDEQINRYSRQIILKGIGGKGQKKILNSKVLIIGAGGLGSPVALYLAAAGVGTIGIVDGDVVEISNLQRQIVHTTKEIGKKKVESAKEKMKMLNPDIIIKTYAEIVHSKNILTIIKDYDFIIDGTDNFSAKFLINDACVLAKKPFSHAGILRFNGQTLTYTPGNACYRCIFEEMPPKGAIPSCKEAGIIGSVAGIIGSIQANEALKFLLGIGELLENKILVIDTLKNDFRKVSIKKNADCPVCGKNPKITELQDYVQPACDIRS